MKDHLHAASLEFRTLLEENASVIADAGYMPFRDFPTGCCEASTHLLAHHLIARGLCEAGEIRMPWNNFDDTGEWGSSSHGWISLRCGINIDITADQFQGIDEPAIVSTNHPVHQRFVGGEWVSFEEHHRRATCHDGGESFGRVWALLTNDKPNKSQHPTA